MLFPARYISEDFSGVALHPVDLFDASTGRLLHQLTDPNLTTISPVNKFHPRMDMLVSGSSSSLYAWRPTKRGEGCHCGCLWSVLRLVQPHSLAVHAF